MPFGCPGGDAQVQGMLQVFLNIIEFGDGAARGDRSPSRHQPQFSEFVLAPRLAARRGDGRSPHRPAQVRETLRDRGHLVEDNDDWSAGVSRVCAITVDHQTGTRLGGADPRSTSYAIGW